MPESKHMPSLPADVKLELELDPATYADADTIKAVASVFPDDVKANISKVALLSGPAFGEPYIVLTISVAIGRGVAWAADKLLGPTFEKIGNWLCDAVKAYLDHRKRVPPAVGLWAVLDQLEVRISIETSSLLSWNDEEQQFRALAGYILDGLSEVTSRNAQRVTLLWDPDLNRWVFCDIWPKDMHSIHKWYIFDPRTGKWISEDL
jgi:hypothetical protein